MIDHQTQVITDVNLGKYAWLCSCGEGSEAIYPTEYSAAAAAQKHSPTAS
jgi:hypothetical protein